MNALLRPLKLILKVFPIFVAVFLAGCGSGSSGSTTAATTITGTAAAGAPVVGYVSVRDSSANPQPVKTNIPIEANGHYSVDVTGLTAPYAFLATGTVGGKTVSLYSAATSADVNGTINITPFTDLIIRNIAATAVDTYLANPANMANLTTAQLNAKRDALTTQLTPALTAMGLSGSVDLLRTTFNADNTGLDRFMDVVKVSTTPTTATITNILDAANTLTIDTAAGGTASGTLGTANLSPTATPLDGILQTFNNFSAAFATSVPNPSALTGFLTTTFLDDGLDASTFLGQITTQSNIKGLNFTNVVIDSIDGTGTIAQIHFTPLNAAGVSLASDKIGGSVGWQVKKNATTGVWQADGNRRIAYVAVRTSAIKRTCNPANPLCSMVPTYKTGLWLEINNDALLAIGSAVVTGPGLPQGGVTLVQQANVPWFYRTTINPNDPLCPGCTGSQEWVMSDTDIAAVLPNSVYTVTLNDLTGAPISGATYTEVVPVAPASTTAVAALAYPSLSGMVNLAGIGTTTLTPSWNIPSGLFGGSVNVYVYQNGTSGPSASLQVGGNNNAQTSSGTASLAITAPTTGNWSNGTYWITARDQYAGHVETNYQ